MSSRVSIPRSELRKIRERLEKLEQKLSQLIKKDS